MSAKHEHYDVIRKPIITEKATMVVHGPFQRCGIPPYS